MWQYVLSTVTALWIISLTYLVYATGHLFLSLAWKEFLLAFLIFAFLCLAEVVIAAIIQW